MRRLLGIAGSTDQKYFSMAQILRLVGAIAYAPRLSDSPYKDLLSTSRWNEAQEMLAAEGETRRLHRGRQGSCRSGPWLQLQLPLSLLLPHLEGGYDSRQPTNAASLRARFISRGL